MRSLGSLIGSSFRVVERRARTPRGEFRKIRSMGCPMVVCPGPFRRLGHRGGIVEAPPLHRPETTATDGEEPRMLKGSNVPVPARSVRVEIGWQTAAGVP